MQYLGLPRDTGRFLKLIALQRNVLGMLPYLLNAQGSAQATIWDGCSQIMIRSRPASECIWWVLAGAAHQGVKIIQ